MTKENKKFDDGLRAIMGDADFDKATNPRERRAPNGQYEEVVKSMDRVLAKMMQWIKNWNSYFDT